MIAPFKDSYAHVDDGAAQRRAEIYEVYLLLAGIVWYRSNELPERERFCRERLTELLSKHLGGASARPAVASGLGGFVVMTSNPVDAILDSCIDHRDVPAYLVP